MAFKFPRLDRFTYLVDNRHIATMAFATFWDKVASNLEGTINSLSTTVSDLAIAQANITSLQTQILQALSTMADVNDVHVAADYTGTVNVGQLPKTISTTRFTGSTDDTTNATWSFTVNSGSITATIADGVLTVTAVGATSSVTITSNYHSYSLSKTFVIYLDVASPPPSAGSSVSDSSLSSFNSTTFAAVSDEMTVTIGSAGQATLSAPNLSVSTAAVSPIGTSKVFGQWQRWNGSSWTSLGSAVSSSPDCTVVSSAGSYHVSNGTLSVVLTDSGLTAGSSQKYRLVAKNNLGSRTMSLTGTATVSGGS